MSFLRSFLIDSAKAYQLLQAIRLTSTILLGVLLVKFGIEKEQLATLEYVLFLVYVFAIFWSNGFNNSSLNFFPKLNSYEKKAFFPSVAILYIICSFLAASALFIGILLQWINVEGLTVLVILYFLIQTPTLFLESQLLLKNQAKSLVFLGCTYILFPVFALIGYFSFQNNEGILYGLITWAGLRFIYFLVNSLSGSRQINKRLIKRFVLFSIPLMLYFILGASAEFVDGFLIRTFFPTQFAEYRYGARELPLYSILITSYLLAMVPAAVNQLSHTLTQVKERLNRLMHILFPIAIVLMFTSPFLFRIVYSNEYEFASQIFNVYLLLALVRFFATEYIFLAKQDNKTLVCVGLTELVLNIILSLVLLHFFGLIGIIYSTVISYSFEKITLLIIAKKKYNFQVSNIISMNQYLNYSLLLLVAFVLSQVIVF